MDWTLPSAMERTPGGPGLPVRVVEIGPDGKAGSAPLEGPAEGPDDVLLGVEDGAVWYARPVPHVPPGPTGFRDAPTDRLATATALVGWHATKPRCERCHGETVPDDHGRRRRCTRCGALLFFRTDPAIIVRITDDADRILVARHESWPTGRVSVIAGFVEAGESLEQACHREVREEVGLPLTNLRYFGSQPWPFPRSLMLGFTARTSDPSALRPDGEEIVEASFLGREELASRVGAGSLTLPGPASIGRALIDAWLSQPGGQSR